MLNVRESIEKGKLVLQVQGRIDAVTVADFEGILNAAADKTNSLIFDLSELVYISSVGLRAFLVAAKRIKPKGGSLLLAGVKGMVRDVFEISGFFTLFKSFDTLEQALASQS